MNNTYNIEKNCACDELHFEGILKTQACELAVTYENLPKNAEIFCITLQVICVFLYNTQTK